MCKAEAPNRSHALGSALFLILLLGIFARLAHADVGLPSVFGHHMVLQQGQPNRVWGRAEAGEEVTVSIGNQEHATVANEDGKWFVMLDSMPAGGPHQLTVKGKTTVTFNDVLVGEVWICSGQSNMAWPVRLANDADLEIQAAKLPKIRLLTVPQVGTQEPQDDFEGQWRVCSPETVAEFSAVGYFFGRQLHQILDVPIGLIDNAWGGSACEAWIRRDMLEADRRYKPLLDWWAETERNYNHEQAMVTYQERLAKWKEASGKAMEAGTDPPPRPRALRNPLAGNQRPANIYNGVLKPTIGYGIRGAIWYQGEANASRAYQYRHLFPLMIRLWREEWNQGDFSYYWVQLADYLAEQSQPQDSAWAELREAQTMTMSKLPNTGQAVIIDLGEGRDIHPRNKQDVAKRLARWALARDYGLDIAYRSPTYKSMEKKDNKIVLTFDHVGRGLYTFDQQGEATGFAVAGRSRNLVSAKARIIGNDRTEVCHKVEVWSDAVDEPVAVRYAWADNPVCNLQSRDGLPVTPFRTDDWPGVTMGKHIR